MNQIEPPDFPSSPVDFLASWSITHGNLRRFFEGTAMPPRDDAAQRAAGAAAAAAARETFDLDLESFNSGVDSVTGSLEAAGALHLSPADPGVPPDPGAAAFFDIDNTLIRGSSLISFAFGLARRKYFRAGDMLPLAWKQAKYRVTGSESSRDMADGYVQALDFIKGRPVSELVELCEEIVDDSLQYRIFAGTEELIQMHLAEGQQVWLVSATPVQLGQAVARRFGCTGALGTVAEVTDGVFTGRLVGDILHGPGKSYAIAALSTLQRLDLERCTAYSDSVNDLPMLSMVGTAVAVNPDAKLRKTAQNRGWEVRDYRNIRRAVRTWGVPSLATAGMTVAGWRFRHHIHHALSPSAR